jgi:hypothetical protein
MPITKDAFLKAVPSMWENDINEYGCYYYGYFKALEIDN